MVLRGDVTQENGVRADLAQALATKNANTCRRA